MVQPSRTPFVMSLAGASRGAGIQRQATRSAVLGLSLVAILLVNPRWAAAHCDTLDGPVVKDARLALETGETLVRVHRAGEGAPFTGLKPTGTPVEPGVAASDNALETGSPDVLVALVTQQVEAGIRERFGRAKAARSRSGPGRRGRPHVRRGLRRPGALRGTRPRGVRSRGRGGRKQAPSRPRALSK